MRFLCLPREIFAKKFSTFIEKSLNHFKHDFPVSKRLLELSETTSSSVQGRHLIALAKTLSNNYKSFIANKDSDIVSRFWFIILARLVDLISETTQEGYTFYSWHMRIPQRGAIKVNDSKQINFYQVVKLVKYLSLVRLLDQESPVSTVLNNAQWITHLLDIKRENKIVSQSEKNKTTHNMSFFNRIFTVMPQEIPNNVDANAANYQVFHCNLTNSPSHLVRYQWILDQEFNFGIPTEYLDQINSPSFFITALKSALIKHLNTYTKNNCNTICYAKLSMYITVLSPSNLILPQYFDQIIKTNLEEINNQLSQHICSNIDRLSPRLTAFIANASGMGGNSTILNYLEKCLIGDDDKPTSLAISLHPDHLENICYAFSKQRIIKRGVFKSLAAVIQYKFDEFQPVVSLNILFSFARVNHVSMVSRFLINKILNYTDKQLFSVSEKVLANAMQALTSFYSDPDLYLKLTSVILNKRAKSGGFKNDKLFYQCIKQRLLQRGVMNEPIDQCILYQQLTNLVDT